MKQRTQAGVGVHCRQSQVIMEYMENTLPTDVDITGGRSSTSVNGDIAIQWEWSNFDHS